MRRIDALARPVEGSVENRQQQLRRVLDAMVDRDRGGPRFGRIDFRFARLQVARQVRVEGCGDLGADAVTLREPDARHHGRDPQLVNAPGLDRLPACCGIPVARAQRSVAGAHQVDCATVGVDVLKAYPQVEVPAVAGYVDQRGDLAGDRQGRGQRLRVEGQEILPRRKGPVVMRPRRVVGIHDRACPGPRGRSCAIRRSSGRLHVSLGLPVSVVASK